jgi:hypothetical protein
MKIPHLSPFFVGAQPLQGPPDISDSERLVGAVPTEERVPYLSWLLAEAND